MIGVSYGYGLDTPLSGRHPRQWDGGSERERIVTTQHKLIPSPYHGRQHYPASARHADLVHAENTITYPTAHRSTFHTENLSTAEH